MPPRLLDQHRRSWRLHPVLDTPLAECIDLPPDSVFFAVPRSELRAVKARPHTNQQPNRDAPPRNARDRPACRPAKKVLWLLWAAE